MRSEDNAVSPPADRDDSPRGQYMVEFALSFSVFIIFVLIVIDLGLLIYNHNLFYHGVSKGARVASLGGTDNEITDAVSREVLPSYFPTMLLVAEPEPVTIRPDSAMHRVDGKEVTVRMDARFGMSMLWFGNVTVGFPIRSSSVIIQNNDQDRDGCRDSLEGAPGAAAPTPPCDGLTSSLNPVFPNTWRNDHLNDGDSDVYLFGGRDVDADTFPPASVQPSQTRQVDSEAEDTVAIGYFPAGQILASDSLYIQRPQAGGAPPCPNQGLFLGASWETCFDGDYHAPELWSGGVEHPPSLFYKTLPTLHVDAISDVDHPGFDTRVLHAVYDMDNDGWEDKYDAAPLDPTRH